MNNTQIINQTQKLLTRVIEYYRNTFRRSGGAQEQLVKKLGLSDYEVFEQHKMGFCDGTLVKTIPSQGQAVDLLKQAGILNQNGGEVFTGCLIIPIFDEAGNCVKLVSAKFGEEFSLADFEVFVKSADSVNQEVKPVKVKEEINQTKEGLIIRINNRSYLIRGMEQATLKKLKVNIKITYKK